MNFLSWAKLSAVACALLLATWFGHHYAQLKAQARLAESTRQIAELEKQLGEASAQVVTRYVDRVRTVQGKTSQIIKEVPIYVSASADAQCDVPAGFVRIHDAAASGQPATPGAADAAPSGVALSAIAETVADNYGTCRETAEQLRALQEWVNTTHGQEVPPPR